MLQAIPKPKRTRASHPKVKSGCTTCRIRRVKCDESKPSCLRCLNFNGHCYGYVRPQPHPKHSAGPGHPRRLVPKAQISQLSTSPVFATEDEHRFYHLFVTKTAHSLSGFFHSEIWNYIVLQTCQSEPSIRHAVTAIAALDMTAMALRDAQAGHSMGDHVKTDEKAIRNHQFALQQYSQAITCMREAVENGKQQLRTTLLACILIICFETYQGNHNAALAQIKIGLELIIAIFRPPSPPPKTTPSSQHQQGVEDEICEVFERLDVQVMTFPDPRPPSEHKLMTTCHVDHIAAMPKTFSTIRMARYYSDIFMRRHMHFRIIHTDVHRDTMVAAIGANETTASPPEKMIHELEQYMADLERWRVAFDPLMDRISKSGSEREYLCGLSLDVQNLNDSTSLAATLGKDQTRFDRFLPQYKAIVSKSRILLSALPTTTFLFDFQCIMPLYIVGRKCRDPVVRREAIALLLQRSWREGVWDSILAGKICKWIMEIEEEGIQADGSVPEWSRVRGTEVNFDLNERSARVRCLRRDGEESDEMNVSEVEIVW